MRAKADQGKDKAAAEKPLAESQGSSVSVVRGCQSSDTESRKSVEIDGLPEEDVRIDPDVSIQ